MSDYLEKAMEIVSSLGMQSSYSYADRIEIWLASFKRINSQDAAVGVSKAEFEFLVRVFRRFAKEYPSVIQLNDQIRFEDDPRTIIGWHDISAFPIADSIQETLKRYIREVGAGGP